jgi:hypothetical protein
MAQLNLLDTTIENLLYVRVSSKEQEKETCCKTLISQWVLWKVVITRRST